MHLVHVFRFVVLGYLMTLLGHEPIDVVIPCIEKDLRTLELCIAGIRQNIDVRRIVVVSDQPLTKNAEWFDEKNYPFSKLDLCLQIRPEQGRRLVRVPRVGWIYQQFLKLYAPFVIPDLSSNVLIVDADTIFLNPVAFFDPAGNALYNPSGEHHQPYFDHMGRVLPGLSKFDARYSGIAHHMLFQRDVLKDLFDKIEKVHGIEAWKVLCRCINQKHLALSSLSEYEIYFNFVFGEKYPVSIRPLKWGDFPFDMNALARYKEQGYHYVSYHNQPSPKKSGK